MRLASRQISLKTMMAPEVVFTLAPGMMQLALAHSLSMLLSFAPTPIRRLMVPWMRNCTLSPVVS